MNQVATFQDFVESLSAKGRITSEDVLELRRGVFPDGAIDRHEAEAVFHLDRTCADKDPVWTRFYVDVLTDYFVWQSKPRGYVDDTLGRFLIDEIVRDGRIDGTSELELLINVAHWAARCPEDLPLFVLQAVKESVLTPETAAYGSNRPPAVLSPADVEILRKVLYAPAGPGGFTVTRSEAELLFELNDATAESENAAGWPDLFVKAVASHLMFPRGAAELPEAGEALRREAWLEERHGVGRLLMGVGKSLTRGWISTGEVWRDLDVFGTHKAREAEEQEAARAREARTREAIDAAEARWLAERLDGDGGLHDNERKLLAFIRETSPSIDPVLDPVFEKVG
jgi:hypothetical protein